MGDKSPKNAHRKAVQKRVKDEAVTREKRERTEAQHHPTSGHTATPSHPTTSDERQPQPHRADQSQPEDHRSEREEEYRETEAETGGGGRKYLPGQAD
jgi:hypothetical protein